MILCGDCLAMLTTLPTESVRTCVTSPPYWGLRDYGVDGQIGLEPTPDAYVQRMVQVFREVKRVLKADGTLWLNLGDSYGSKGGDTFTGFNARWDGTGLDGGKQAATAKTFPKNECTTGLKPKDLVGIPWRVAFALQADGWYLRSDIIWAKPNPMPESVTDRPTKAHEYIFLLSKSERYFYDHEAIKEEAIADNREFFRGNDKYTGGNAFHNSQERKANGKGHVDNILGTRNKRSVWEIATQPYPEAHFATFPPKLIEPCILAGSRPGDTVLDPFAGSGTTLYVAKELNRKYIGIELNKAYVSLIHQRLAQEVLKLE
jgi:DNA modification methylase